MTSACQLTALLQIHQQIATFARDDRLPAKSPYLASWAQAASLAMPKKVRLNHFRCPIRAGAQYPKSTMSSLKPDLQRGQS